MLRKINALSWKQIADMPDRQDKVLLLPISSLEQHGPQLPVGTDDFIIDLLFKTLIGDERVKRDILVLPGVHYGLSPEHMDFTGTFTLSPETLINVVEDIIRCMNAYGFKKLLLFNSHGGNNGILHGMAQTWKRRFGVEIFHIDIWDGSTFERTASAILDTPVSLDVHGGEIETSLLMYTGQATMTPEEIAKVTDYVTPIPNRRGSWTSLELSKSGACGGVSLSTAEKGEKLTTALITDTIKQLNAIEF